MVSINQVTECGCCSQSISTNSYQCSHCLITFCYQCLIKHHHNHIKNEFIEMINQIDKILERFLYHAHSQTEWTNHLTEDQERLRIYIRLIETSSTQYLIVLLPDFQWVHHVKSLIDKSFFAIHENCCTLMYPSLT